MRTLTTLAALATTTFSLNATDWPGWRGPDGNGHADPDQSPPTSFSETENVLWSTDVPGRGHGSPCVAGDQVYLAVADEDAGTQGLLCLDRKTGKQRWLTTVHDGPLPKTNKKASHASSTPACDGERVYINFVSDGAAHLTALDLGGEILWQKKISPYVVHQGYGSSPKLYKHLVIVAADNKSGGAIAAYERASGKLVWKHKRPDKPNYPTPMVFELGGKDQLLMQGTDLVTSLDPLTGKVNWEHEGATTECVSSLATDGKHVFTSGGYPKNHVAAVVADGSGDVTWDNISRVYVPSMLVHKGHLFAVQDNGVAVCWDCKTGEEKWKERLVRTTSSSPILVGDLLYAADESGNIVVYKAAPEKFEVVAENKLGDETLSTLAICDSQIFARAVHKSRGSRQEKLYCIGTTAK